jgi:hypothetical protein
MYFRIGLIAHLRIDNSNFLCPGIDWKLFSRAFVKEESILAVFINEAHRNNKQVSEWSIRKRAEV